jgi:hypothetical protein
MRKCAAACAIFIVLQIVSTQTLRSQTTTVQRDPQALAILAKTILTGGAGDLLSSIQDITETGIVTYYTDDPTTGNVTIKARGLRQFRMEADMSTGRRTTVVNGAGGSLIEPDGQSRPIYRQSRADLGSITLPYLPLIAAIEDGQRFRKVLCSRIAAR